MSALSCLHANHPLDKIHLKFPQSHLFFVFRFSVVTHIAASSIKHFETEGSRSKIKFYHVKCNNTLIFVPPLEIVLIVNAIIIRGRDIDANHKCACQNK